MAGLTSGDLWWGSLIAIDTNILVYAHRPEEAILEGARSLIELAVV